MQCVNTGEYEVLSKPVKLNYFTERNGNGPMAIGYAFK